MSKKYTYHTGYTYTVNGKEHNMLSQLYQMGVYVILDGSPSQQYNVTPDQMVSSEKSIVKAEKEGKINNLVLNNKITVQEVDGFWTQIN